MWCRQCRQDVAGIPLPPRGQLGCARCGQAMSDASAAPGSPVKPATSPQHPMNPTDFGGAFGSELPRDLGRRTDEAVRSLRRTLDLLDRAMDRMIQQGDDDPFGDSFLPPQESRPSSLTAPMLPVDESHESIARLAEMMRADLNGLRESRPVPPPPLPARPPATSNRQASIPEASEPMRTSAPRAEGASIERQPLNEPIESASSDSVRGETLGRRAIAELDREIRTIEEILDGWQPRRARRQDASEPSLARHFGDELIESRLQKRREGFRSQIVTGIRRIRLSERQVSLLLLANLGFFLTVTLTGLWSNISPGTWSPGYLLSIAITGQIGTLVGLAWMLSHTRTTAEQLEGAEREFEDDWSRASHERRLQRFAAAAKAEGAARAGGDRFASPRPAPVRSDADRVAEERRGSERAAIAERFERNDTAESIDELAQRALRHGHLETRSYESID